MVKHGAEILIQNTIEGSMIRMLKLRHCVSTFIKCSRKRKQMDRDSLADCIHSSNNNINRIDQSHHDPLKTTLISLLYFRSTTHNNDLLTDVVFILLSNPSCDLHLGMGGGLRLEKPLQIDAKILEITTNVNCDIDLSVSRPEAHTAFSIMTKQ